MSLGSLIAKQVLKSATKKTAKGTATAVAKDVIPAVVDAPVVSAPARKSLVARKQPSKTSMVDTPTVDDVRSPVVEDVPLSPVSTIDESLPIVDSPVIDSFVAKRIDRTEDFGIEPDLIAKENEDAFDVLGITPDSKEKWRKENKSSQRQGLLPEIEEAAQKLSENKISSDEFRALSQKAQPIVPMEKVPEVPSFEDITNSLTEAQVKKGIVGVNMKLPANERVSSRLDIPAYNDYNTWVVSLHDGSKKSGAAIGYAKTAVLKNVEFVSDPKVALDIARRKPLASGGRMGKATIARIFGDWVPHDPDAAKAYAEKVFKEEGWSQVGMNPYRASYFYDKADGMPVVSADEIVQIGPLVMAKNVKKTTPKDPMFKVNPKEESSPTFAAGGAVMQTDELLAEGGVMQEGGTVDPVSGNEVPVGAMQEEVRDDIDAKLSEGEFVFPADVVRFYGLEKLMMMRDKAKKGLQRMNDIGQMGNAEEVPDGEALFGDEEMDDDMFSSEIDSIMSEEEQV
jgi:hypothetical protein